MGEVRIHYPGSPPQTPVKTGSYTGNGQASRVINLGAKPQAVLVVSNTGLMGADPPGYSYERAASGGLAVTGSPARVPGSPELTAVTIVSNGFQVCFVQGTQGSGNYAQTNRDGVTYNYAAFF